jgi:hypothetical protein
MEHFMKALVVLMMIACVLAIMKISIDEEEKTK